MQGDTSPSITVPMVGGQVGTNAQFVSQAREAVFYSLNTGSLRQQQLKFLFVQKKLQECDPPEIKDGYIDNFKLVKQKKS